MYIYRNLLFSLLILLGGELLSSIASEANDQFELAKKLDAGLGVKADAEKAADLYYKAATQGHADAAEFLATLYEEGRGVKRDSFLAAEWKSLAKKND